MLLPLPRWSLDVYGMWDIVAASYNHCANDCHEKIKSSNIKAYSSHCKTKLPAWPGAPFGSWLGGKRELTEHTGQDRLLIL